MMEIIKHHKNQYLINVSWYFLLFTYLLVFSELATAQAEPINDSPKTEIHTVESGGPNYLNPVSNTGDLNLLAGIFGNIARAAAGQIDLATLAVGDPNTGETAADNILSSIMSVYLMGILAITALIIVILIGLMTIQSGQEGAILTKRYNEWVAIRTLYAVFAMMPVLGGWSIGQYAILSGTFFVNTMTNEMNHVSSRWVFANGTTNSIDLDPFKYRSLIETVYLNEVCAQINNKTLTDYNMRLGELINAQIERGATGNLSEATAAGVNQSIEWLSFRANHFKLGSSTIQVVQNPSPDTNSFYKTYTWSSPILGESVCGEVIIDFTSFKSPDVAMNNTRIGTYFNAQIEAMDWLTNIVKADISSVVSIIDEINRDVPITKKEERELRIIQEANNNPIFAAFAFAFDPIAKHHPLALDQVLAEKVGSYRSTVSRIYLAENERNAELFDQLLNEIARRQREGEPADYLSLYDSTIMDLSEEYKHLATPEIQTMLANTSKGWIFAGYKWWDLSKAQTTQLALQANIPKGLPYTGYMTGLSDISRDKISKFGEIYTAAKTSKRFGDYKIVIDDKTFKPSPTSVEAAASFASITDIQESIRSFHTELGPWVTGALTSGILENFESTDLLTNLQSAGHKYLIAGEVLWLASTTLPVLAASAESGGGIAARFLTLGASEVLGKTAAAIFKEIAKVLSLLAGIFLMVGFLYAVYLPLLPAMIWTFAIIGWLEKLISLIIIFPVWMLGHVFPEGDGIVNGIGRQGYVLTANVLLRPPVQFLALHFAMAALGGVGFLLTHFIEVFLPSSNNGYSTGLVVGVGSFIVMSGFIVVICHMILAWIYKIPDEIPHYIGGGASNFGESEGKGQIQGIVGVVSGQTQSGANTLLAREKEGETQKSNETVNNGNHGIKTKQKNKRGSMGV